MSRGVAAEALREVLRAPWVEADVATLRDALYQLAFARSFTAPPLAKASSVSPHELTRQLSAANQSCDRWLHGWRIERVENDGTIMASCGARRRKANAGEYALTFTEHLPPRVGMAASLFFPRESLTMQRGVYYAFGDTLPSEGDETRPLRLYFRAPEEALVALYENLTAKLNQLEIPFTLKSMLLLADRDRSDATVLYVARRNESEVVEVAKKLSPSLLEKLGPQVPLFTLRLAPGIGLAESPSSGESFGMHRCRLLAEGILDARKAGGEDAETRFRCVERRFQSAGIDLEMPHVINGAASASLVVLGTANLMDWLRSERLLNASDEHTTWEIEGKPSRNRNFAARRRDGTGFFVKQLRVQGSESLRMMEREASVYRLLAQMGGPVTCLAPTFHCFNRQAQAVVMALVPGAQCVAELQAPSFPIAIAQAAGRTLGLLHTQPVTECPACFDRQPPGVYTAHRGGPLLQWLGPGQRLLVQLVRDNPVLAPALDQLATDWRCERLVHGDVKWENCLWSSPAKGEPSLTWIDWELADLGNPCWDAGCFLQAYLSYWVRSLPPVPEWMLADRLREGAGLFNAMLPAAKVFLCEYLGTLKTPETDRTSATEQILRCAAARMVQMALEVMHGQPSPTPMALCLLSTAAEIMSQPGCLGSWVTEPF